MKNSLYIFFFSKFTILSSSYSASADEVILLFDIKNEVLSFTLFTEVRRCSPVPFFPPLPAMTDALVDILSHDDEELCWIIPLSLLRLINLIDTLYI